MLSRDSEYKMWSRFVFELVIWPQQVTWARRTQPSGPLCLWQCFLYFLLFVFIISDFVFGSVIVCYVFYFFYCRQMFFSSYGSKTTPQSQCTGETSFFCQPITTRRQLDMKKKVLFSWRRQRHLLIHFPSLSGIIITVLHFMRWLVITHLKSRE